MERDTKSRSCPLSRILSDHEMNVRLSMAKEVTQAVIRQNIKAI